MEWGSHRIPNRVSESRITKKQLYCVETTVHFRCMLGLLAEDESRDRDDRRLTVVQRCSGPLQVHCIAES
jgi:hypothetical protein